MTYQWHASDNKLENSSSVLAVLKFAHKNCLLLDGGQTFLERPALLDVQLCKASPTLPTRLEEFLRL